jgi:hydrogenase expression/formation protein HypE
VGKLDLELMSELLGSVAPDDPAVIVGPGIGRDVAVLDVGAPETYLLAKSDPITFATDAIGYYAVHVNANDIATSGGVPRFFLGTLLLPESGADEELARGIFQQIHEACQAMEVLMVGGHTEVTYGLDRPILVGMMLGEAPRGRVITSAGAQVGDRVLLTKGVAVEGTSIIARELGEQLKERGYEDDFVEQARGLLYEPGISVLREARAAVEAGGVHAMHDPTEGGVATGLHEMALASGVGLKVEEESIPILPATERLCAELHLEPLGLIASGSLLITAEPAGAERIAAACRAEGIACADIGEVTPEEEGLRLLRGESWTDLPRYDQDEVAKLF